MLHISDCIWLRSVNVQWLIKVQDIINNVVTRQPEDETLVSKHVA